MQMSGLPPQACLKASPQHLTASAIKPFVNFEAFEDTFTIVRNPYERLMSEYRWQMRYHGNMDELPSFNSWVIKQLDSARTDQSYADNHIRPMIDFVSDFHQIRVFRYEAGLSAVLEYFMPEMLYEPPPLGNLNRSADILPGLEVSISSLPQETLDYVNDFYSKDFSEFSYPIALHPGDAARRNTVLMGSTNAQEPSSVSHGVEQAIASADCICALTEKLAILRAQLKNQNSDIAHQSGDGLSALAEKYELKCAEYDQAVARLGDLESQFGNASTENARIKEVNLLLVEDCGAVVNDCDELKARLLELETKLHEVETARVQLQNEYIETTNENARIKEANLRLIEDYGAAAKESDKLKASMVVLDQETQDLSSALVKQRLATQSNLELLMAALEKMEEYHEASKNCKTKFDKLNLKFMSAREDLAWNRDRLFWYRDAFPSAVRLCSEYVAISQRLLIVMSRLLNSSPR
jgi:hypothetical protein